MKKKGFTLVELMVVVTIIGILAAIAIPVYRGQQKKAVAQEALTNLQSIRLLAEQYYAENGRYLPTDSTVLYYRSPRSTAANITLQTQGSGYSGFQPGNPEDMKFEYAMISCPAPSTPVPTSNYNSCNTTTGVPSCGGASAAPLASQTFVVCAIGRKGTLADKQIYWINNFNQRNF